ncbi:hypothetical protein HW115_19315 [Verrucomicrobiaceae bacterium N1E253]|uniref:Uncharacterized protein n=1 Tax=Oceaniferula marina TaxID=2748318 RepID=A0A851GRW8_9BACT|nr:hypothetical protein [Oceaniferula marina]NWK57777.1 hypothetical protein [Oceaniferula marina]
MAKQNDIRSRMLAGHIDGTTVLGDIWRGLSEFEALALIEHWRRIMDSSGTVEADIIDSIATNPKFSAAWNRFSDEERTARSRTISSIAVNDLKLPDGSVKTSRSNSKLS